MQFTELPHCDHELFVLRPLDGSTMWTVVYFEDAGGSKMRLQVVSMGFTPDDASQKIKAFFQRDNACTVMKLQEKFRK